ncbi:MAG TPA: TraR/DksA family transcriptional regulator [Proteobacteria bacterium]|nr:RNA polymerase-binding transcription factor DksA [bacterium BMS3Abin14]HDL52903.1 TraR/DksA family transcriptional regulator [Pseudomonadota bacterium]
MTKEGLDSYRAILLERRMDLDELMTKRADDALDASLDENKDTLERARASYATDFNISLREKITRDIREIDQALERITGGEFGICELCGDEIQKKRLEVRPNARYCIKCKEDIEKRGVLK